MVNVKLEEIIKERLKTEYEKYSNKSELDWMLIASIKIKNELMFLENKYKLTLNQLENN